MIHMKHLQKRLTQIQEHNMMTIPMLKKFQKTKLKMMQNWRNSRTNQEMTQQLNFPKFLISLTYLMLRQIKIHLIQMKGNSREKFINHHTAIKGGQGHTTQEVIQDQDGHTLH